MADEADVTQDRAEKEDEARAKVIAYMAGCRELLPMGRCYYCLEPVSGQRLFCDNGSAEDKGCAGDYEAEKKQLEKQGK